MNKNFGLFKKEHNVWCENINKSLDLIKNKDVFKGKTLPTQHNFLVLNTYLLSFLNKSDAKIYNF